MLTLKKLMMDGVDYVSLFFQWWIENVARWRIPKYEDKDRAEYANVLFFCYNLMQMFCTLFSFFINKFILFSYKKLFFLLKIIIKLIFENKNLFLL